MTAISPVLKQIAGLPKLSHTELKALWREYFGAEPPAYRRGFLIRGLAHRSRGAWRKAHPATGPVPNHLIRSRFTPPDRAPFEPASLRVVLKPLNMRASYIRTKMPVVRLCQRR